MADIYSYSYETDDGSLVTDGLLVINGLYELISTEEGMRIPLGPGGPPGPLVYYKGSVPGNEYDDYNDLFDLYERGIRIKKPEPCPTCGHVKDT